MRILSVLCALIVSFSALAVNHSGEIRRFTQPDGTEVDVRLYGSEFYIRAEGMDGYTVVRNTLTKWIEYANLNGAGTQLLPTNIAYRGIKDDETTWRRDLGLPLQLDITPEARQAIMDRKAQELFGLPGYDAVQKSFQADVNLRNDEVLQGNLKGLTIVIDFSDQVGSVPLEEFEKFCNQMDYKGFGNNGSLRTYYHDISGGLLDYENEVFGYFRAPKTFQQYDDMPYAQGAREILQLALEWIRDQGFDFSTLSTNPDGTIMAINMMYTGNPPTWAEGMWHHQGFYGGFSANGIRSGRYNTSPANNPLAIAVVVHENGHMIGKWPDTYKYNSDTGPDGIGAFDVMCWYGPTNNPVLPNPYFVSRVGWGQVTDVTNVNAFIRDTANIYSVYKYQNPENPAEFYMFQNRVRKGRSQGIPDEGLTVWHIDRNGNNQTTHHETYLVHANNVITNHSGACFNRDGNGEFGDSTVPSAFFYNGKPSGLRIWDLGDDGDILTYRIGSSPAAAFEYVERTDEDGNGFIDPGEIFSNYLKVVNIRDIDIHDLEVNCTPTGSNAHLLFVISPTIVIDTLLAGDTMVVKIDIQMAHGAPNFTLFDLRFEMNADSQVYTTNYRFESGHIVIMDSIPVMGCEMVFYDPGGYENYENNTDMVQTFYPSESGKVVKVEFLEFNLQPGATCQFDHLQVFNGADLSNPFVRKYCGSALPPDFISSDTSGALTFRFYSGLNTTLEGWRALITCEDRLDNHQLDQAFDIAMYPNPASDIVHFEFEKPDEYALKVYNSMGSLVVQHKVRGSRSTEIDTGYLAAGMYVVTIQSSRYMVTRKLLIQ